MKFKDDAQGYGLATKALHWLTALMILGVAGLGAWMVTLSYYDTWYHKGLGLHRAIGLLALATAAVFIAWRLVSSPPDLPASIAGWQRKAAVVAHFLFFALMILMPVSGYLVSTSAGAAVPMFDLFEIPALFRISEASRELAINVHFFSAYGTVGLATLHVAAAFKHQFIDRDGVLARMLWR